MFNKKQETNYNLNLDELIKDVKNLPRYKVFIDSTHIEETVYLKDVINLLNNCTLKVDENA